MSADPSNNPIALITLTQATVPLFTAAGGDGNFTSGSIQLYPNGATYVTQSAANATLVFTGAGFIEYMFADSTIRPIGIGFKSDGSKGAVGRGDKNLPLATMSYVLGGFVIPGGPTAPVGAGIQVYDAYASSGSKGQYKWEYFIIFQDANGVIGAIDPSDENDNND